VKDRDSLCHVQRAKRQADKPPFFAFENGELEQIGHSCYHDQTCPHKGAPEEILDASGHLCVANMYPHVRVLLSSVATAQPKSKVACGWTGNSLVVRTDDWAEEVYEYEREKDIDEEVEGKKRDRSVSSQTHAASSVVWEYLCQRLNESNGNNSTKPHDDQYGTRDPHETLCASLMGGAQCVDSLD